jgi:hypothetical protein
MVIGENVNGSRYEILAYFVLRGTDIPESKIRFEFSWDQSLFKQMFITLLCGTTPVNSLIIINKKFVKVFFCTIFWDIKWPLAFNQVYVSILVNMKCKMWNELNHLLRFSSIEGGDVYIITWRWGQTSSNAVLQLGDQYHQIRNYRFLTRSSVC